MVFIVHVIHNKDKRDFQCSTKRDFLTKILKNYGIIKDELVLINKKTEKEIQLDDICDDIAIEVKTRHVANGQRPETSAAIPPFLPQPNVEDLVSKLTENRALTGLERKWLIKLAVCHETENSTPNRKRNRDEPIETANKKLQAQIIGPTVCTQTDPRLTACPVEKDKPSCSSDVILKGKLLAKKDKRDPKEVEEFMTSTYNQRRNFILIENPVVTLVKEKYPLLFTLSEVRNELNRIFYDGKDEEVLSNIRKHATSILTLVNEDDTLLKLINEKIEEAETEQKKQYAREVGALLILSNTVNEKRMYLSTEDEPFQTKTTYPHIEVPCSVKDLFVDNHTFQIVVENLVFCEAFDFCEAVLCLLATFFIFNISYPERLFNTLVVMERVFLEANDTDANDIDPSTLQIVRLIPLKTLNQSNRLIPSKKLNQSKSTSKKH